MVKKDIFQLSINQLNGKTKRILLLIIVFATAISIAGVVMNGSSLYQAPGKILSGSLTLLIIFFLALLSIGIAIESKECRRLYLCFSTLGMILLALDSVLAVFLLINYPVLIFLTILSLCSVAFPILLDC